MDESENKEQINEEKVDEIKEEPKEVSQEEPKAETKKKSKKDEPPKSFARELLEWVVCIVVAFSLAIFVKYFIFTPTLVLQSSMYPTIFSGERVYVNRLVRTFKSPLNHGDIITFGEPEMGIGDDNLTAQYAEYKGLRWFIYNVAEMGGKRSLIKRVIGLAGDTVKIEGGSVYINGELLDESEYLPDGTITEIPVSSGIKSEFVVPEGYVFCMGDNRTASSDCRMFGCIPIEKVEGRVVGRIWPLNKFGKNTKSEITKEEVDEYDSAMRITSDLRSLAD